MRLMNDNRKNGVLSGFHALPKTVCVSIFIVLAVSFGRYDIAGTGVFAVIPFALSRLSANTGLLFKRTLCALGFVVLAGAANCFFDTRKIVYSSGLELQGGVASLIVLIFKTFATAGAATLLVSTSGADEITRSLRKLGVPGILVFQIRMMIRYIELVFAEALSMKNAYFLRNPSRRTIPVSDWGKLAGQLFIRTNERSKRIYLAMKCRLFDFSEMDRENFDNPSKRHWIICACAILIFAILRCFL